MSGREIAAWVAMAAVVTAPAIARADTPQVKIDIDPEVVQPGQPFRVRIEATTSDGSRIDEVTLPTPAGATRLGESQGPYSSVTLGPGGTVRRSGINATYTFSTTKLGKLALGKITIRVGSTRYVATTPNIRVSRDAPTRQRTNDPFGGMFPNLPGFPGFGDDDMFGSPGEQASVDPSLALPKARGQGLFFFSKLSKTRLITGEPVTFDVLEYVEDDLRDPAMTEIHEASTDGFLSKPLEVRQHPREIGLAEVEGKRYRVKLFRRYRLIPLHAGTLTIGPLQAKVPAQGGRVAQRDSQSIEVVVGDPVAAGRPNGYVVGTVGAYEIGAELSPASIGPGERAVLTVTVRGDGRPPASLVLPEVAGVSFQEPEIRDSEAQTSSGETRVTRTFTMLIDATAPGRHDLGAVQLPSYLIDHGYTTYEARIGTLEVSGVAPADAEAATEVDSPLTLGAPLTTLAGPSAAPSPLPRGLYALPLLAPLAMLIVEIGQRLRRRGRNDVPRRDGELVTHTDPWSVANAVVQRVTGLSTKSTSREEWTEALRAARTEPGEVDEFLKFFDDAEAQRWGGSESAPALQEQAARWRKRWL